MIDFSPLCPPAEPRSRMRTFPSGKARSSETTTSCSIGDSLLSFASRHATACPLRFMKVCGLTNFVRAPSISPRPTSELHSRRPTTIPSSWANLSINMNPRLCRDHSYSFPGLPKPTISMTYRKRHKMQFVLFVVLLRFALFALLALANHFRLGRLFAFSRRRCCQFLFLHDTDCRDHLVGICQNLDRVTDWDIRDVQKVVNIEIRYIDLQHIGNLPRLATNLDFANDRSQLPERSDGGNRFRATAINGNGHHAVARRAPRIVRAATFTHFCLQP